MKSRKNDARRGFFAHLLCRSYIFARPPSEVSRKRRFMLVPVSYIVRIAISREIRCVSDRKYERLQAFMARMAATAFRSMQGT